MRKAAVTPILVGMLCVGMAGCGGISKAKYDKIRYGMRLTEIDNILGKPSEFSEFDASDFSLEKIKGYKWEYLAHIERFADTCEIKIWGKKGQYIQVMFMDGQAVAKRQEGV